ncbi:glycosyltransferase family 2 protein [Clostridium perfringens]|uniref:glycosyltransferase family 2 protein n=1 Tax=Clostridium perfringens TaxID=1502 RepID=UPI002109234F|nr:glycosyltransferase family 2 protein [Clostridium perfringens]
MKNKPLVSVCIPMYNATAYIKETLDSLINQTYENIEVIIVDDGSTDNSVKIVESITDSRIKLYRNNKNMGLPYTRNKTLELAKGKYIALIDADDIAEYERIELQVEFMEKNFECGVLSSYANPFGNISLLRKIRIKMLFNKNLSDKEIKSKLLFSNVICNPSAMIRKCVLDDNNIKYRKEYTNSQDYGLWIDLINKTKFCVLRKKLVNYRFGHENISKNTSNKKYDIHCKLSKQIFENIGYLNYTENECEILAKIYLKRVDIFRKSLEEIDTFLYNFKKFIINSNFYYKDELLVEIERQRYYFSLYYKHNKSYKNINLKYTERVSIYLKVRIKQILQKLRIV